jgi:hypothetical protein
MEYDVKKAKNINIEIGDNPNGVEICGDIFFRIINGKKDKQICRFALNTAFIKPGTNKYVLDKWGVDPDSIAKDPKYDNDFKVELVFEEFCYNCSPENHVNDLCNKCCEKMPK